jgi:hypothetical protein
VTRASANPKNREVIRVLYQASRSHRLEIEEDQISLSIRLEPGLESKVQSYLRKNKIKFSQLVSMAVAKFISEPQVIELVPADTREFLASAEQAFEKHKDAMDKLK